MYSRLSRREWIWRATNTQNKVHPVCDTLQIMQRIVAPAVWTFFTFLCLTLFYFETPGWWCTYVKCTKRWMKSLWRSDGDDGEWQHTHTQYTHASTHTWRHTKIHAYTHTKTRPWVRSSKNSAIISGECVCSSHLFRRQFTNRSDISLTFSRGVTQEEGHTLVSFNFNFCCYRPRVSSCVTLAFDEF